MSLVRHIQGAKAVPSSSIMASTHASMAMTVTH